MKLTIKINMDNAAFEDATEVDRILGQVTRKLLLSGNIREACILMDSNGNKVGTATVTNMLQQIEAGGMLAVAMAVAPYRASM